MLGLQSKGKIQRAVLTFCFSSEQLLLLDLAHQALDGHVLSVVLIGLYPVLVRNLLHMAHFSDAQYSGYQLYQVCVSVCVC